MNPVREVSAEVEAPLNVEKVSVKGSFEKRFPPQGGERITRAYIPAVERAIELKKQKRKRPKRV